MPKDAAVDRMRIFTRLHYKFIESWRSGEQYLRMLPKLLTGRDYAAIWPPEPKRHSERLRFYRNYVRLARRFYDAKRNRLGDRNHQQSAALVRKFSNAANIFDRPEKVR